MRISQSTAISQGSSGVFACVRLLLWLGGLAMWASPAPAAASETLCLLAEAASFTGCPQSANTLTVPSDTSFSVRVVYDPKGGRNVSGVTADFTYPANTGQPACDNEGSSLPAFSGVEVDAQQRRVTVAYFSFSSATQGVAKFVKCTFPGGADGVTGTFDWLVEGSGGATLALDNEGSALNTLAVTPANLKIETPPCTLPAVGTLSATPLDVGGVATCQLTWTPPPDVGEGNVCALAPNPYALSMNGAPVAGSPFSVSVNGMTLSSGVVFDAMHNFSLTVATVSASLAAVTATCTPTPGAVAFSESVDLCNGAPLCATLALSLNGPLSSSTQLALGFDVVRAENGVSCLKAASGRQAAALLNWQVRLPVDFDAVACPPASTVVNVVVKNIPKDSGIAHVKNVGTFPCLKNKPLSDLSGGGTIICPLITPAGGGDANRDKLVDLKDLGVLKQTFSTAEGGQGFNPLADFNDDKKIDIKDLGVLKQFFNMEF